MKRTPSAQPLPSQGSSTEALAAKAGTPPPQKDSKQINHVGLAEKLRSYRKHPLSLILILLVLAAAAATFFVLFYLIGYILVKGVPYIKPSLFELNYTTENVSMFPAIVTTIAMMALSLLIAAPLAIFTAMVVTIAGNIDTFSVV